MDNFNFYNTGENDRHLQECEDQEPGKMCICDELIEKWESMQLYNQEVDGVIREAIKL